MSDRIIKVNELLKEQVARIILEELELEPGTIISVISVSTSSDLRYAKVYVGVLPDEITPLTLKRLNNNTRSFQKRLSENISLKFTPRLKFYLDETEKKASKIDELLDNLKY
ncbi:MAG: 30S ribosome-binding factor RbfA [Candidatus Buchananbacteria bacterium]